MNSCGLSYDFLSKNYFYKHKYILYITHMVVILEFNLFIPIKYVIMVMGEPRFTRATFRSFFSSKNGLRIEKVTFLKFFDDFFLIF